MGDVVPKTSTFSRSKAQVFIHFSSFHYTSLSRNFQLSFFQLCCRLFSALSYLKGSDAGVFPLRRGACSHAAPLNHVTLGACHNK